MSTNITFDKNWNNKTNYVSSLEDYHSNHTSSRSPKEVAHIIEEMAQLNDHPLSVPIKSGFNVQVLKGIHPDSKGTMHLLVQVQKEKYHVNLEKRDYRNEPDGARTFVWRASI